MIIANNAFFNLQIYSRFSLLEAKSCVVGPKFNHVHANTIGMVAASCRIKHQKFKCLLAFLQILVGMAMILDAKIKMMTHA